MKLKRLEMKTKNLTKGWVRSKSRLNAGENEHKMLQDFCKNVSREVQKWSNTWKHFRIRTPFRPASGTIRPIRCKNTLIWSRNSSANQVSLKMYTIRHGVYWCPFSNLEDLNVWKKTNRRKIQTNFGAKLWYLCKMLLA